MTLGIAIQCRKLFSKPSNGKVKLMFILLIHPMSISTHWLYYINI